MIILDVVRSYSLNTTPKAEARIYWLWIILYLVTNSLKIRSESYIAYLSESFVFAAKAKKLHKQGSDSMWGTDYIAILFFLD